MGGKDLKRVLKEAKTSTRGSDDTQNKKNPKKPKKKTPPKKSNQSVQGLVSIPFVVNALYNTYWHHSISRDMLEADGENKLAGLLNENEYTHQFLNPMFKQVLHNCPIKFRL